MSKVDQHAALRAAGFDVPRTIAVIGRDRLIEEARNFPLPFITKHNQGGRGLGVQKFETIEAFEAYVTGPDFEQPVDGITLLQEYVRPADGTITRVELVGGEFVYALRADTSQGFTLCPADNCAIDELSGDGIVRAPLEEASDADGEGDSLFHWRQGFDHPIVARYLDFCRFWDIGIVGIEFIESDDGRLVTYDINTNTNYNPVVEAEAGRSAPEAVARYLGSLVTADETALVLTHSPTV